jgi:PleD family two-component response regulator
MPQLLIPLKGVGGISRGEIMSTISVPHRILVVDDEAVVRELFVRLLEKEGYEVATAEMGLMGC